MGRTKKKHSSSKPKSVGGGASSSSTTGAFMPFYGLVKAPAEQLQGQGPSTSRGGGSTSTHSSVNTDGDPNPSYSEWNPMKGVSESLLNAGGRGTNEAAVEKLLTGVGDLDLKDVLCPFNDGRDREVGGCYKKDCPYKHVKYSNKVLNELPKLQTVSMMTSEKVNTVSTLPIQILPANDCISKAVIVACMDPGDFHVIPEYGWECLCESHHHHNNTVLTEKTATCHSYSTLENLQSALQKCFQERSSASSQNDFLAGELVAVRMKRRDDSKTWYRAKVLRDSVKYSDDEDDLFKPSNVEVMLLDYGLRCIKIATDVSPLPLEFCRIRPMAYRCELFGVSPIMGTWSTAAIHRFKQLVMGHYVIVEVIRTAPPPLYSIESSHCLINIHVKSETGDYIDVAQDLINLGLGIEWNLHPKSRHFNDSLEVRSHRFAFLDV